MFEAESSRPPRQRGRELLFFAIVPPPAIARRIFGIGLQLERRLGGRARPERLLHLTLRGVEAAAQTRPGAIAGARHAAWRLSADPFELALVRYEQWTPLVLRPAECPRLARLQRSLEGALHEVIPGFQPIAFEPHLSVTYGSRPATSGDLARPISWLVEDFVLIRSFQGRSRYEELARYRLGV